MIKLLLDHSCLLDVLWFLVMIHSDPYENSFKKRRVFHVSSCCRCSNAYKLQTIKACMPSTTKNLHCWKCITDRKRMKQKNETTVSTSESFSDWLELHEKRFNLDWRCNSNLLCLQRGYRGASGVRILQQI